MRETLYTDFRCRVYVNGNRCRAVVTGSRSKRSAERTLAWPAPTIVVWFKLLLAFMDAASSPAPRGRVGR